MRHIKRLGLVASAAVVLTAFLAAASASATILCETTPTGKNVCGTEVATGTKLVFSAEGWVTLKTQGVTIATCTGSTMEAQTTNKGGATATVTANILTLTFNGCNRKVTVNSSTTGTLELHHIAGSDNGTLTSEDTTFSVEGFSCHFVTKATDVGTLTGKDATPNGHPTIDVKATIPQSGGCLDDLTWEGSYEYEGTTNFNLSPGGGGPGHVGTTLCEVPSAGDCTSPVAKGTSLAFSAESSVSLTGPFGEVIAKCSKSTVEGATGNTGSTTESVWGSISKLTFEECPERTVVVNSSTTGTLEVQHVSGTANGAVISDDTTVTVKNTFFGTCTYLTSNTPIGTLTGRSKTAGHPTFDITAKIPSENGCPSGTWEGSYEYKGSTDFDVAGG